MTATATAPSTGTTTTAEPSWRDTLPDDLKSDKTLESFKGKDAAEVLPAIAKSLISTKAMIGADKVVLPGKNATPEQLNEFYTKLGRPEAPDKYELPTENMPADVKLDEKLTADFAKEAHALGLNKQQYAALVRFQATKSAEMQAMKAAADKQTHEANVSALRKEFGLAFDEKVRMAQEAVEKLGGEDFRKYLNESGLGNHPTMIKVFAEIGKQFANDEILGQGHHGSFKQSPAEAQATIAAKMADPTFTEQLNNTTNPGHAAAKAEWTRLHQIAHPEPNKT